MAQLGLNGYQQVDPNAIMNMVQQALNQAVCSNQISQAMYQALINELGANPKNTVSAVVYTSGGNPGYYGNAINTLLKRKIDEMMMQMRSAPQMNYGFNMNMQSNVVQNLGGGLNQQQQSLQNAYIQPQQIYPPAVAQQVAPPPPAYNKPVPAQPTVASATAVMEDTVMEPTLVSRGQQPQISKLSPNSKSDKVLLNYEDTEGSVRVITCKDKIGTFESPLEVAQYVENILDFNARTIGFFTYNEIRVLNTPTADSLMYLPKYLEGLKTKSPVTAIEYFMCLDILNTLSENPVQSKAFCNGFTEFITYAFNQIGLTGGLSNCTEGITWFPTCRDIEGIKAYLPNSSLIGTLSDKPQVVCALAKVTRSAWYMSCLARVMETLLVTIPKSIEIINYSHDPDKLDIFAKVIGGRVSKVTKQSFLHDIFTVFGTTSQSTRDKARTAVTNALTEFTKNFTVITIPRQILVTNLETIDTGYKNRTKPSVIDYLVGESIYENSYKYLTAAIVQVNNQSMYKLYDCGITDDSNPVII